MDRLTEVKQFAEELIKEYVPHYSFKFTNGIRTLGYCKYNTKVIGLSKHHALQSSDELVIDTVLHEISHAIVGQGHGHNHVWKAKCREIGAKPQRCKTDVKIEVAHKYEFRCATCVKSYPRHRKPRRTEGYSCNKCKSKVTFHYV